MAKNARERPGAAPKPAVSIRAATPADAQEIVTLVRALAAHVGDEALAKVTPGALAKAGEGPHPLWRGVIAEAGGKAVGMGLYCLQYSTWIGAPGLYVIDLYIVPGHRHGKMGRQLLAAIARQGRALGCRFIRLDVDHRNTRADAFYERLGFERRGGDTIFLLKPEGFDALAASGED